MFVEGGTCVAQLEKNELSNEQEFDSRYKKSWDSNWKIESSPAPTIKRVKCGVHEMRCFFTCDLSLKERQFQTIYFHFNGVSLFSFVLILILKPQTCSLLFFIIPPFSFYSLHAESVRFKHHFLNKSLKCYMFDSKSKMFIFENDKRNSCLSLCSKYHQ